MAVCLAMVSGLLALASSPASAAGEAYAPFGSWSALVNRQYLDVTTKAPSSASLNSWVSQLGAGTKSKGDLVDSLRRGSENLANVDPVVRVYRAFLGRAPDAGGLKFWIARKRNVAPAKTWTVTQIATDFTKSNEFKTKYGSLTNRQFVTRIYTDVLGRAADTAGVNYWTGKIDRKEKTKAQVMVGFSESNEYKTKQAQNTDVAVAYIYLLGRAPTAGEATDWVTRQKAGTTHAALLTELLSSGTYAARILGIVLAVPGAPTAVAGVAGDGQVTVSWTAPASNGGSAITGYVVTPSIGGTEQAAVASTGTGTSKTITGLTNGTGYTFEVAAVNAVGTGAQSAPSDVVIPEASTARILTSSLPAGVERQSYSATVLGDVPPGWSWSIASGPTGVDIDAEGHIDAVLPPGSSTYHSITVELSDGTSTVSKELSITIAPPPTLAGTAAGGAPGGGIGSSNGRFFLSSTGVSTKTYSVWDRSTGTSTVVSFGDPEDSTLWILGISDDGMRIVWGSSTQAPESAANRGVWVFNRSAGTSTRIVEIGTGSSVSAVMAPGGGYTVHAAGSSAWTDLVLRNLDTNATVTVSDACGSGRTIIGVSQLAADASRVLFGCTGDSLLTLRSWTRSTGALTTLDLDPSVSLSANGLWAVDHRGRVFDVAAGNTVAQMPLWLHPFGTRLQISNDGRSIVFHGEVDVDQDPWLIGSGLFVYDWVTGVTKQAAIPQTAPVLGGMTPNATLIWYSAFDGGTFASHQFTPA